MRIKYFTIFPDLSYILTSFDFCLGLSIFSKTSLVRKIARTKTSERFSMWVSISFFVFIVSSDNLMRQINGELEQPRTTVYRVLSELKQEFAQAFDLVVSILQTEISRILLRIHSACEAMWSWIRSSFWPYGEHSSHRGISRILVLIHSACEAMWSWLGFNNFAYCSDHFLSSSVYLVEEILSLPPPIAYYS